MSAVDAGNRFSAPAARSWWVKIGPLVGEMHLWWFRIGICAASPGYVGIYLGFVVITVGRRRWLDAPSSFTVSWLPRGEVGGR